MWDLNASWKVALLALGVKDYAPVSREAASSRPFFLPPVEPAGRTRKPLEIEFWLLYLGQFDNSTKARPQVKVWLRLALEPRVVNRALKYAVVVGAILIAINEWDLILHVERGRHDRVAG